MDSIQMIIFLPLIMFLLSIGQAQAFTTQTPEIPGFNGGKLTGGSGYSTAAGTYARTATVVINGKTVGIPGALKAASTMGSLVKAALRASPYKIVGTLAAGWLIDQGIQWLEDQKQWVHPGTATGPMSYTFKNPCVIGPGYLVTNYQGCYDMGLTGNDANRQAQVSECNAVGQGFVFGDNNGGNVNNPKYSYCMAPVGWTAPAAAPVPMTDADWNALADPMPTVGNELPTAQYLPEGVTIVDPPAYIPQTVTVGAPYTKADGSTAQPMAKISPAGDGQVTIDTYEQPLTNPDGTPVPAGTPTTKTADQPPPPKDPCVENPTRIGCMTAGSDSFATPKTSIAFSFTQEASPIGAGSCPAPISVLGHTISYQPVCDAIGKIRALIIAMASIVAAFILVGAFKAE